ncbi:MAG: hypothetical protein M0Q38_03000 [Bacteroidales bacterium]|jgi:type IV pilus biogenesis protein CpaD/CtpE|nr:hypothetical protein [Bacteroidales bacterium]
MKKLLLSCVFLSIVLFSLPGCKKDKEITCNLSASVNQPPVEMNVKYSATQTGDGAIVSLSYVTITGTVTIENPQLPWTITVPVLTSTNVTMTATGNVKNGSLKISYQGINGGSTISGSDYCEQQTN